MVSLTVSLKSLNNLKTSSTFKSVLIFQVRVPTFDKLVETLSQNLEPGGGSISSMIKRGMRKEESESV